jgi:hypothetical protein
VELRTREYSDTVPIRMHQLRRVSAVVRHSCSDRRVRILVHRRTPVWFRPDFSRRPKLRQHRSTSSAAPESCARRSTTARLITDWRIRFPKIWMQRMRSMPLNTSIRRRDTTLHPLPPRTPAGMGEEERQWPVTDHRQATRIFARFRRPSRRTISTARCPLTSRPPVVDLTIKVPNHRMIHPPDRPKSRCRSTSMISPMNRITRRRRRHLRVRHQVRRQASHITGTLLPISRSTSASISQLRLLLRHAQRSRM